MSWKLPALLTNWDRWSPYPMTQMQVPDFKALCFLYLYMATSPQKSQRAHFGGKNSLGLETEDRPCISAWPLILEAVCPWALLSNVRLPVSSTTKQRREKVELRQLSVHLPPASTFCEPHGSPVLCSLPHIDHPGPNRGGNKTSFSFV